MSYVNFKQGADEKVPEIPIVDGNLIIGFNSDNTANMYIDAELEGKMIRFKLGQFTEEYIQRIMDLEASVTELKQISGIEVESAVISMKDNGQPLLVTMLDDNNVPILIEFNTNI